jgi:hypothetical protein
VTGANGNLTEALSCNRQSCECHRAARNGKGLVHCPAHDDEHPSLSVSQSKNGKRLIKCMAGCSQDAVIEVLKERGLWPRPGRNGRKSVAAMPIGKPSDKVTNSHSGAAGLSTAMLAAAKNLSPNLLREWGVSDSRYNGVTRVAIPYLDGDGNTVAVRYRLSLAPGGQRFNWRRGDHATLYGLNKLKDIRDYGWVLLVEGESDTWTGWHYGVPVLGIPGKSTWRREWAEYLVDVSVYLWVEPGADDLVPRVGTDVPGLMVVRAPEGVKDVSDAHLQGRDVAALVETLKAKAVSAQDIMRLQTDQRAAELQDRAAPVLALADPLEVVKGAISASGYGGDVGNALVVYLAATSRLLAMRHGAMPVHLVLLGPPSAGKSYTLNIVLGLLPEEAKHVIDAGSPRTLVYDDAPLQHRVLVFGEADSLPAGEDNPAASAVRNLAQDNHLHYAVTVRDPESGDFTVRHIDKAGPTVLVTTSVRPLGGQLMTRLFTLDVSGDAHQVRAALAAQASLETDGATPVDNALVDFQAYLQALAPWDVVVPFAPNLSESIGQSTAATRILRDFQRLLSLIKAAAVLRHQHRSRDKEGRLVATIEDYQTVFELVADIYTASVTGVSEGVTDVVTKVAELHQEDGERRITYAVLDRALGVHRDLIRRRANTALRQGWLVNQETKKRHQADLVPGDPMPEKSGLPHPDAVCHPVTPLTDGHPNTVEEIEEGDI